MPFFVPPQCPQCSTVLAVEPLWAVAKTNGFRLLEGSVGLHCPACGIPLAVVQSRIGAALVGTFAGVMALLVAWLFSIGPGSTAFLDPAGLPYAILIIALGILYWRSVPRLARVRFVGPEEGVGYPLEAATKPVDPEPPLDEETADDESAPEAPEPVAVIDPAPAPPAPGDATPVLAVGDETAAWICPACHEENPAEFLICWKCQGPHPGFSLAPKSASTQDEEDPTAAADEVSPPAPRA